MGAAAAIGTVGDALAAAVACLAAAGVPEPRADAEVLLARALDTTRVGLVVAARRPLPETAAPDFAALVARRAAREPLPYSVGEREFWPLPLAVDRRVLVPRPETELVVEPALRLAPAARRVLDVGTGSGAIAAALARELPAARVWASDVDTGALAVARANLARQAPGVALVCGDLLAPFRTAAFDLVAANPPYVADAELGGLAPEVRDHEPRVALAAGPDGLAALGRLMAEAPRVLAPGGWLVVEVGAGGHDRDPGGRRARGRGGGERVQERGAAAPLRDPAHARALGGAERAGAGRRAHHDPGARAPGRARHAERRRARGGGRAGRRRVHRGALRAGEDDARLLPRAGAAPRPLRPRPRLDPGRLRHRRATRRPPPERPPETRGAAPHQRGLRGGRGGPSPRREDRARLPLGGGDAAAHDGRRARRGDDRARERGARAGEHLPGARARAHGGGRPGRGHLGGDDRGVPRARRRRARRHPGSHRGRYLHGRGGGDRRRGAGDRGARRSSRGVPRQARRGGCGGARARERHSRRGQRQARSRRREDHALSRLPDRPPGAVHDPHDARHRHQHAYRDDLREPLPARAGAGTHGRRYPRGRPSRHRARAAVALRRPRDGDRPARQRLPRAGRARGPRHDARVARLPPGPRLRAHRGEALGARRRHRAREGGGVKATELVVTAGSGRARARLARLDARGSAAGERVEADVRRIIARVRRAGDRALLAFTRRFDGVALRRAGLRVPREAMAAAYRSLPERVRRDLELAARRIRVFHARQRERSWSFRDASGARLGQRIEPLARVGVYVPGGRAAYPSTVRSEERRVGKGWRGRWGRDR